MKFKVKGIKWDVDLDELKEEGLEYPDYLHHDEVVELEDDWYDFDDMTEDEIGDAIVDRLSDLKGWLIQGIRCWEKVEDEG
jgi:hypothetical protein